MLATALIGHEFERREDGRSGQRIEMQDHFFAVDEAVMAVSLQQLKPARRDARNAGFLDEIRDCRLLALEVSTPISSVDRENLGAAIQPPAIRAADGFNNGAANLMANGGRLCAARCRARSFAIPLFVQGFVGLFGRMSFIVVRIPPVPVR